MKSGMRTVLLLLLTLLAVCSVPSARSVNNDDEYDRNEPGSDEEKERLPLDLDEHGDTNNDPSLQTSKSSPDVNDFEDEATTDALKGDDFINQTDIENSSVSSLPSTAEEDVLEDKKRSTQPSREPGTCGPPPTFERTTIATGKNATYGLGSVVTYSCQFGYVSDGLRQVKCLQSEDSQDLSWSRSEIRCTPRSCGDPGYVDNGKRIGSLFTFPNKVSFECKEGYKLKGNAARYCQPSGTWSGRLPKCEKLSCDPPPGIENGKVSYSSLEYGSELRYTCDPGFILKKHHTRYCAGNRTWSGEDPICEDALCDLPVAPKDGSFQLIGDKPAVDTRVIFKCDGNKILSGNKVSICMDNGDWTFPPPKCLDPCSIPRVPNGKIKKYGYYYGWKEVPVGSVVDTREDLYLTCDRNYEPLGTKQKEVKITCTNGAWEDEPRCVPGSCEGAYPQVENGFKTHIDKRNGGYVWYKCLQHYTKIKTGNITCSLGTWIGNTPVCSDSRCYFSKLPHNRLVRLSHQKETFSHNEGFTPVCKDKYTPTRADNYLKCENGVWKGTLPPCMPASCTHQPPPKIDHGKSKPSSGDHSSIVEYECEEGYFLVEEKSSKVECLYGEWKGLPPKCQDSRCYHKNLEKTHGLELYDDFTPSGDYMTVKCTEGFTAVENSEPYCSKGIWKQPISPCKENSCTASKILNGGFHQEKVAKSFEDKVNFEQVELNREYEAGDKLFVICEGQFTFHGKGGNSMEVQCSEGQWDPDPVCLVTGTPYSNKPKQRQTTGSVTARPNSASLPSVGTSEPPDAEACACTYLNLDDTLVGFSDHKRLQYGTRVKKDCRVKFYCRYFGQAILSGKPELVCEGCRDWHSREYPQCVHPSQGDVLFHFSSDIRISDVDEITLYERQSLDIFCYSCFFDTVWERLHPDHHPTSVSFRNDIVQTTRGACRASVLQITEASIQSSGIFKCLGQIDRPRYIRIKIEAIQCPFIGETDILSVTYENGQYVNNHASFSCKEEGARLVGHPVLTCRPNGQWSGDVPRCDPPVQLPQCSLGALFQSFPKDVTIDNEERKGDTVPYNSTVNLRCKEEHQVLVGKGVATCNGGENWILPNIECVSGCLPLQPADDSLIVEPSQSTYDIGDAVDLSCPVGMEASRDVVRLMCLHHGWSETELPTCSSLKK